MKKKDRHVKNTIGNNNDSDASTWTCEHCKSFLKSCEAVQLGSEIELIDRCVLLKHLIANGHEKLMTLWKRDLISTSDELPLHHENYVSKDNMIKNVFNVVLDVHGFNWRIRKKWRCDLICERVIVSNYFCIYRVPSHVHTKFTFFDGINSFLGWCKNQDGYGVLQKHVMCVIS